MNRMPFVFVAGFLFVSSICFAQKADYEAIHSRYFKKLYRLNDSIYRSEQPSKKGFKQLEASGIKTILNLRRLKDDNKKAKGTQLRLEHIPMRTAHLTEADIVNALGVIQKSEKPVLVHCWHGSDRTGTIIAAYRMVFENWSKERAISEFRRDNFGYHERKYPNLKELLENLDVPEIKKKLSL